jgi:uncharacterized membrane protein
MRALHILAGLAGLVSGATALLVLKGGRLHRQSGMVFVYAMLFMSASGALMTALKPALPTVNIVAGLLTFYMVLTGVLTVRPPAVGARWIQASGALMAFAIGATAFGSSSDRGGGVYFIFGAVALLAAIGDTRLLLGRRLDGPRRLARHLWRMCFSLFVAAGSFFLGQAQVFPKAVRGSGLLPIPVLAVLATMVYWLVRVRIRRQPRIPGSAPPLPQAG